MKSTIKLLGTAIFMAMVMLTNSCKGPQGDVGPAGATGLQGVAGTPGPAGPAGTANVIYSAWTPVTFTGSGTSWSGTLAAPKITQDIFDKGVILTYLKTSDSRILAIPYTVVGSTEMMMVNITVGQIKYYTTQNLSTGVTFRYVAIPGGVAGRVQDLKNMSYEEVKVLYGLKD